MIYEWSSLKPYEDQEDEFLLVVKCVPSNWRRKLLGESIRFQMYVGRVGAWYRYPSMEQPKPGVDPSIKELNQMLRAARIFLKL